MNLSHFRWPFRRLHRHRILFERSQGIPTQPRFYVGCFVRIQDKHFVLNQNQNINAVQTAFQAQSVFLCSCLPTSYFQHSNHNIDNNLELAHLSKPSEPTSSHCELMQSSAYICVVDRNFLRIHIPKNIYIITNIAIPLGVPFRSRFTNISFQFLLIICYYKLS